MEEDLVYDNIIEKVDYQIESFNKRRYRFGKWSNRLSVAQMVGASAATAIVAINIHFTNTYVAIVAIIFSSTAVLAAQLLQYFKFQERLQIAVTTVSRLHGLRDKMGFDLKTAQSAKHALDPFRLANFFDTYQNILDDANQAWSGQIQATIANRNKANQGVPVENIQS